MSMAPTCIVSATCRSPIITPNMEVRTDVVGNVEHNTEQPLFSSPELLVLSLLTLTWYATVTQPQR